jgi:lipopolysaccharide export system protein LptA
MSKNHAAICFWAFAFSLGWSSVAHAERADRDAAMAWEADSAKHDDLKQITNLKGNVIISKGSIRIRAAAVEIKVDAEGYQLATAQADAGKRAFFRQKREGVDEFIEAEGESLLYNERADTVQFTKSAVLRRFRGATLSDEVSGSVILYDNKTESFSVDNGASSAPAGAPAGRVRGMLTPRASASAPAPAGGAPALRASSSAGAPR